MSTLLAKNGKIIGGLPVPLENLRLLWSNPNPTAAYGSGTIDVNTSDYDFVLIFYALDKDTSWYRNSIISQVGTSTLLDLAYNTGTTIENRERRVSIYGPESEYANKVTFNSGYVIIPNSITENNNVCIPVSIYGIKKDSSSGSDSKSYMTVHVDGVTDGNGNYNCGPLVPSTVYGAVFNPASDCWANGIITPWLYPQSGNKGVFHVHAINWNGTPATGAAVKGDLRYIIDL